MKLVPTKHLVHQGVALFNVVLTITFLGVTTTGSSPHGPRETSSILVCKNNFQLPGGSAIFQMQASLNFSPLS